MSLSKSQWHSRSGSPENVPVSLHLKGSKYDIKYVCSQHVFLNAKAYFSIFAKLDQVCET